MARPIAVATATEAWLEKHNSLDVGAVADPADAFSDDDEGDADFEAEGFIDELKAGTTLLQGQYTILSYLNSGGFGITYTARNSLDRIVVIKECFPNSLCRRSDAIVRARSRAHQGEFRSVVRYFVQEARSLSKMSHPNIVGVHQVFEDNDTAYMVIDYVEGKDLLDLIADENTHFTPENVISMLSKVLEAVACVHNTGMLHRDISPDNILIDKAGNPILIDFGAARDQATKASRVLSQRRVVKDGYSPQEFYLSGSIQGPSSDLYALAATFYHVVSGVAPPESQRRLAALAEGDDDPYEPLDGRFDGFPPGFLAAIDMAASVLPKDRIDTAEDWLSVIDAGLAQQADLDDAVDDDLEDDFIPAPAPPPRRVVSANPVPQRPVRSEVDHSHAPVEAATAQGSLSGSIFKTLGGVLAALAVMIGFGMWWSGGRLDAPVGGAVVAPAPATPQAATMAAAGAAAPAPAAPAILADNASLLATPVAPAAETQADADQAAKAGSDSKADEDRAAQLAADALAASQAQGAAAAALPAAKPAPVGTALLLPRPWTAGDTALVPNQFLSASWRYALPFSTEVKLVDDQPFPVISAVDPTAIAASPASSWITPGVTIFAINGKWVADQASIENTISVTTTPDPQGHVISAVRIRPADASGFVNAVLEIPATRQVELKNGIKVQTSPGDSGWRSTVENITFIDENGLRPGDVIRSEITLGKPLDSADSLEALIDLLVFKEVGEANFEVERNGTVISVRMPLTRE